MSVSRSYLIFANCSHLPLLYSSKSKLLFYTFKENMLIQEAIDKELNS